jgi:hypothetical protein
MELRVKELWRGRGIRVPLGGERAVEVDGAVAAEVAAEVAVMEACGSNKLIP